MRTHKTRKPALLQVEVLEDRRVLSLLGISAVQQNLSTLFTGPTASGGAPPQQASAPQTSGVGSILTSLTNSVGQTLSSTLNSVGTLVQNSLGDVGQLVGSVGHTVSDTVASLTQTVGPTLGNVGPTVSALSQTVEQVPTVPVQSSGGIVVSPVQVSGQAVETGTQNTTPSARSLLTSSDGLQISLWTSPPTATAPTEIPAATGLTAAPGSSTATAYVAAPPAQQALPVIVNGVAPEAAAEPALIERGSIEAAAGTDEFGVAFREDPRGHILPAAMVQEEMPSDSLMSLPPAQEADLLTNALPPDTASLDLAIQQFLSRVDDVGEHLSRVITHHGWLPWALGATLTGVAALEFTRRGDQKRRRSTRRNDQSNWFSESLSFERP